MVEKLQEGYVKGVMSGDYLCVSGKLKGTQSTDIPEEINLFLVGVSAPKTNSQTTYEEDPCGWESRNYMRNLLIGKVIKYSIEYTSGENNYAKIFYDGKNLNVELVRLGLAKINTNKTNEKVQKSDFYKNLKEAESEASRMKVGVWKVGNISKIKITKQDDVKAKELFDQIKGIEVDAMIETVFNCSFFLVLLKEPYNCIIKANLRFVAIPNKESDFYKAGKAYVERLFAHRDVKLKAHFVDDKQIFTVDLIDYGRFNPALKIKEDKNLSNMVLGSGFSKLYISTNIVNEKQDLDAAKEAQANAQNHRLRVFEDYVKKPESEVKKIVSDATTFEGIVQFAHSGDSLSIKDSTGIVRRVFFSHTKAPNFAKPNTDEEDKPWAWQSKEYLRKNYIGKKVKAEFDFTKEMKEGRQMHFYSIFLIEEDKIININSEMIELGLAEFNAPRGNDKDSSQYLDSYRNSAAKAKDAAKGIYSLKSPGIPSYCDLIQANPKKKRDFVSINSNLKGVPCVVEHVFSATRFKLRIDKTTCFIPFKLVGLKCVEKDKNNTKQIEELYNQGVEFISDNFLQREGVVDVVQTDKVGNYFGTLTVNKINVGTSVISNGHAVIYNPLGNTLPSSYKAAEEEAANSKKGIWSNPGLDTILREGEVSNIPTTLKYVEKEENIKLRVVDMVDFKSFFANILPNKPLSTIEKTLYEYEGGVKKGTPLNPPIKKGTLCLCHYTVDFKYYRVKILAILKDDKFEVEFIDYGTIDVVNKRALFIMDDSISTLPPQVVECELASLKYSKNSHKKSMDLYPNFIDFDAVLHAKIVYTYVNSDGKLKHGVVIYKDNVNDIKQSMHYNLISKGFAKINSKKPVGKTMLLFKDAEKAAESKAIGMWNQMEESDDEADII